MLSYNFGTWLRRWRNILGDLSGFSALCINNHLLVILGPLLVINLNGTIAWLSPSQVFRDIREVIIVIVAYDIVAIGVIAFGRPRAERVSREYRLYGTRGRICPCLTKLVVGSSSLGLGSRTRIFME